MFYPHPEKSARLDEICSLSSVCEPRGMVSELSYPISSFSPNEMFTKNDSSPSFRTFSVKQRKPSLVRLPSVPVCHLGFLPLSPAEVGWLWEHRERGALSSLAHHTNYSWSFQVFSSPYMFCSSVYIHTDTCVSIHAHTPTLDTYPAYTHTCMVTLVLQKVRQTHFCHAYVFPSTNIQLPPLFLQNNDTEG